MIEQISDQEFKDFLSLQTDKVKRNVTIVTPRSLGQNFFLHIDPEKTPKEFIPMMPRSAATSEDNTVPRITVADTLRGCMQGWGRMLHSFHEWQTVGLHICKLEFDFALKPNRKLVFDAEETGECWLVTYNVDTRKYKPVNIGKLFLHKVGYTFVEKLKRTIAVGDVYMEIFSDDLVRVNNKISVTKGYYKLEIALMEKERQDPLEILNCIKMEKKDYNKAKSISASTLDTTCVNIPLYQNW